MLCNKQKKLNIFMLLTAVAVFLLAMAPGIATGAVIYVDASASGGNNGSSWSDAYKYLQDALTAAGAGDEIWVAAGTYRPDEDTATPGGTGSRWATFQLIDGVALYGGFAGTESSLDARDWQTNVTILSGDLLGDDGPDFANNSDNSYHVVTGSGTDATAVLGGFTVTGGNAGFGGGMYNNNSSPTLTNCTFSGNSALYGGGMSNVQNSSPTVTNCTFSGNSAVNNGGGMFNNINSSPTLTDCMFSDNSALNGGGMFNFQNSSPIVTNCTFSGNSVWYGGGMSNVQNSSPTVTNCFFIGNKASIGGGGGMCNQDSCSPTVTNCTFSGNSAIFTGGGMFNNINSSPTVTNCILWGDSAPNGPEIFNDGTSSATVSYSDVQGGETGVYDPCDGLLWGAGNIDADPCFVDAANGDYHLLEDSPCVDAGDNTAVPSGVTTDLDGNPRIVNGIVDMGAFEAQLVNQPPVAVCQDVTVMADSYCEGVVEPEDVDNGSSDPDGDPITLSLSPVGPYPMETTHVTLTVSDDQGGSSECTATVKVLTASEGILRLIAKVMVLNLHNGIENSLDAKLENALKALDDLNANNDVAAINAIEAFINHVQAQSGDKISVADADDLIYAANNIIVALQNGCY
jgi:hypothetical protein